MRLFAAALGLLVTLIPQQLPVVQLPPEQAFTEWLTAFRAEASSKGISDKTLDAALDGLEPVPVVIERDRSQAELVLTLDQYLQRRLTPKMTATGRKMAKAHRKLLAAVSDKYGVPPGIIVAVWGLESNFGRFSGVRPTVATLATLAYDRRRATLFRQELIAALQILDSGDVSVDRMRGSWAGALGQAQFMPSSFLQYAQDFDGDGRRDIWTSLPDVFASIANYLKEHGWTKGQIWGRQVKVPPSLLQRLDELAPLQTEGCLAERQMSVPLPLSEWKKLGVTQLSGRRLPAADLNASMVRAGARQFLLYPNYQAILSYNCVHAYGLSVALLSDRIH
jgi:membrane-bound lytic murein transglycosylase B